jgi:hypothetical protein
MSGDHKQRHACVEVLPSDSPQGRRRLEPRSRKSTIILAKSALRLILIGFESEEDWFDYRLEHDARFLRRIEQARNSLRAGRGVRLEDVETE